MIYHFLCLALFACSLVQAEGVESNLLSGGKNPLSGIGSSVAEAAQETVQEDVQSVKDKIQSGVDAGRAAVQSGVQSIKTGIKLGLTGPRFIGKVFQKASENNSSDSSNSTAPSFNKFIKNE